MPTDSSLSLIDAADLKHRVTQAEKRITSLDAAVERVSVEMQNQSSMLASIVETLRRQDELRSQSERAMRKVIWAANMLGPKSIATAALVVSLLYEWLKQ